MRLFVALNLPDETRNALGQALEALHDARLDVRWTAIESVHLTLLFLGEVKDERVADIESMLAGVAKRHGPFRMEMRGFAAFPNVRRARVWWVGVEPTKPLMELQHDVEEALVPPGFEPEKREYHPHLTVARARPRARPAPAEVADGLVRGFDFHATFPVHTMDLMRSRLDAHGARYEPVAKHTLSGAA